VEGKPSSTPRRGEEGPPPYADPEHPTGKEHCARIDWLMAHPEWPGHVGVEPDFDEEDIAIVDRTWEERGEEGEAEIRGRCLFFWKFKPKFGMVQKRVTAQGGWGRRPEGDAPRSEASALGARWLLPARPQPPSYCHLRG
jgi:hypothetical protein